MERPVALDGEGTDRTEVEVAAPAGERARWVARTGEVAQDESMLRRDLDQLPHDLPGVALHAAPRSTGEHRHVDADPHPCTSVTPRRLQAPTSPPRTTCTAGSVEGDCYAGRSGRSRPFMPPLPEGPGASRDREPVLPAGPVADRAHGRVPRRASCRARRSGDHPRGDRRLYGRPQRGGPSRSRRPRLDEPEARADLDPPARPS